jgi:proteasome activator subunit 4
MVKFKKQIYEYNTTEVIREQTGDSFLEKDTISINKANPGYRADNKWHFYDPNFINTAKNVNTQECDNKTWNKTKFLDKSYIGYYCWPDKISVSSNTRDNYIKNINSEYSDAIKPIRDKFQFDSEFVKKFVKYSIIEEARGNEKLDKKKFYFFKSLFRNYGSIEIFNGLYEHLVLLIDDKTETQECSHKLAAELISGLIRGSKYWKLDDLKILWSNLKSLFDLIFDNIATETLYIWNDCFLIAFVSLKLINLFVFLPINVFNYYKRKTKIREE